MNKRKQIKKTDGQSAIANVKVYSKIDYRHTGCKVYLPKAVSILLKANSISAFEINCEIVAGNPGKLIFSPIRGALL
jgi:hypothetical protein